MKTRKNEFTKDEFRELQNLISKKVLADRDEQKSIRNRIRKIGFHFSDFSSKKGYDISDLESLVKSGQIKIKDGQDISTATSPIKIITMKPEISKQISQDPFDNADFRPYNKLDNSILDQTGLYCIQLKKTSKLPDRYQNILDERENRFIYIGKAQGQTLRERLSQEVYHTRPGTFFRSIGAVLGFTPIPGHLNCKSNQKNYKFSKTDTKEITNWLLENTEYSIYPVKLDFSIEDEIIKKHCPLLNNKHNHKTLKELKDDRKKCRVIAIGK